MRAIADEFRVDREMHTGEQKDIIIALVSVVSHTKLNVKNRKTGNAPTVEHNLCLQQ